MSKQGGAGNGRIKALLWGGLLVAAVAGVTPRHLGSLTTKMPDLCGGQWADGANNGLFFFYSDHPSVSLRACAEHSEVTSLGSTTRYLPFGGYRGTAPSQAITDRDFTGQRENMELGLLYYNARYYLPGVARFISADTIVPNPTNPQNWNRYSYTNNNPVRFTDPTGHCAAEGAGGGGQCTPIPPPSQPTSPLPSIPTGPIVTFSGEGWSAAEQDTITASATVTGTALASTLNAQHGWNLTAAQAFLLVYNGSVNFIKTGQSCLEATGYSGCWGRSTGRNSIEVYTDIVDEFGVNRLVGDEHWAVHELGHSYADAVGRFSVGDTSFTLPSLLEYAQLNYGFVDRPPGSAWDSTWGFAGGRWAWQRSSSGLASEEFADMYLGWVYGRWEMQGGVMSRDGQQRADFMNLVMPFSVDLAIGR